MTGGSAKTQGNESPDSDSAISTLRSGDLRSSACRPAQEDQRQPAGSAKVQRSPKSQGIAQGPAIELSKQQLTVIRWTTNNLGGSPVHYGVVHYGRDPHDLRQTASSPIRLNPSHASAVFRVRLAGLNPETTYYYRVDSIEANGNGDGLKCSIKQFTTR